MLPRDGGEAPIQYAEAGLLDLSVGRRASVATSFQPFWTILASMKAPFAQPGKTSRRGRKRRSNLLEVWLEQLEKVDGPRRRRAAEFRRRRSNPMRRAPNRTSQLRVFGALH
jgi:hypothetical protein